MKLIITGLLSVFLLLFSADHLHAKKKKKSKKTAKTQKVYLIKRKALSVLTLEQVASLSIEQRIKYLHHFQRAVDAAEQMSLKVKKIRKNYSHIPGYDNDFWKSILSAEEAYAAKRGGKCIVYGGLYDNCDIKKNKQVLDPSLKENRNGEKGDDIIRCGELSGLKGSGYEYVNAYDRIGRSTAPYGTYASCGAVASAVRQRVTSKPGSTESSLQIKNIKNPTRQQTVQSKLREDQKKYWEVIGDDYNPGTYRIKIEASRNDLLNALRVNDKDKAVKVLEERKKILSKVKHLTMVHEIKAHTIRLAADYKKITGSIPADLDTGLDVLQFDGLAAKQKTINDLSSGNPVGSARLMEIGFTEQEALQIEAKLNRMRPHQIVAYGSKILKEKFGLERKDGVYSNFDYIASEVDDYFSEAIRLCTGKSSTKAQSTAYNPTETGVACDPKDPKYKDCVQYTECLATIEIQGDEIAGGEFKSVMDAYISLRDPLSSICHTLPHGDPEIPQYCLLDTMFDAVKALESAQIVNEPRAQLIRNESFGCGELGLRNGDPITRTASACAVCALEKDASVLERLRNQDGKYLTQGISTKWMALLEIVSKGCGTTNGGTKEYHVKDMLRYAQVFGHCSNVDYSWSEMPSSEDAEFIKMLQTKNYTKQSMDTINEKFKKIFGFHLKKSSKSSSSSSSFFGNDDSEGFNSLFGGGGSSKKSKSGSGSDFSRDGLLDMFCPKGAADDTASLKDENFQNYKNKLRENDAALPPNLRNCMNEGVRFAENNYHPGINSSGACYVSANKLPQSTKIDTAVVKILTRSKNDWRCGFSDMLENRVEPNQIHFNEVRNLADRRYRGNTQVPLATVVASRANETKHCSRSGCDGGRAGYSEIIENKCLAKKLNRVSPAPGRSSSPGNSRQTR